MFRCSLACRSQPPLITAGQTMTAGRSSGWAFKYISACNVLPSPIESANRAPFSFAMNFLIIATPSTWKGNKAVVTGLLLRRVLEFPHRRPDPLHHRLVSHPGLVGGVVAVHLAVKRP